MALYLSWPAVSQIWALIVFPSTWTIYIFYWNKMTKPSTCMDLVANSTPIVDFDSKLNAFLVNLEKRLDFPTPESPIRTTKNLKYSRRPLKRCMSKAMSLYCCKIAVCLHPSSKLHSADGTYCQARIQVISRWTLKVSISRLCVVLGGFNCTSQKQLFIVYLNEWVK